MKFTNKQLLWVVGLGVLTATIAIVAMGAVNGNVSSTQPIANSTFTSPKAPGNLTLPTTGTTQITTTLVTPEPSRLPYGQLVLTSEPAGATVFIDNQAKGITPFTLSSVNNGDHTVVFMLAGYQNRTIDVTVASNVKTIDVVLQPNEKPTTSATTQATTSATTPVTTSPTTSSTTQATTPVTTSPTTSATTAATTSPAGSTTTSATTSQPVTIVQVNPTYIHGGVSSATSQTISITGTGLTAAAGMKLTGMNTITATSYTAASDSSATGDFSIPAATTGSYSVVLVDSSGTTLATSTATVAIASYS